MEEEVKNYALAILAKHFNIEFPDNRVSPCAEATAQILLKLANT